MTPPKPPVADAPAGCGRDENATWHCLEKAGGPGSSFYYATLFLATARRDDVAALHAFRREVEEVAEECSDPSLARLKLDWWRQEIARAFAHEPRHPVTRGLVPAITRFSLPREAFLELIDGVHRTLGSFHFSRFEELHKFLQSTGSTVELLAAEILGYHDPATRRYARELGVALRLTELICRLGTHARRGRVFIPQDELERFGVDRQTLVRGEPNSNFEALMAYQYDRAQASYDRALACLPDRDRRSQLPGLIAAATSRALLEEIRRDRYRLLHHEIALTPLRKFWIAWATRWREGIRSAGAKPKPGET